MFAATVLARYADGEFTITGWGIITIVFLALLASGR